MYICNWKNLKLLETKIQDVKKEQEWILWAENAACADSFYWKPLVLQTIFFKKNFYKPIDCC